MKWSMASRGGVIALSIVLALVILAIFSGGSDAKKVADIDEGQGIIVGNDNTLYMFSNWNGTIQAVGADGKLKWTYQIPDQWSLCYNFGVQVMPDNSTGISDYGCLAADSDSGIVYVYLMPMDGGGFLNFHTTGKLMAISGGKALWERPLESRSYFISLPGDSDKELPHFDDVNILARGDRIYVFHDYNETVLDSSGNTRWNIAGVSDPAAVDEAGFVYAVRSTSPKYAEFTLEYRDPSDTLDAFYPNGSLFWERSVDSPLARQSTTDDSLPLYNAGAVYAPMDNGVTAFDRYGNVKWTKTYDPGTFKFDSQPYTTEALQLYSLMPFDSKGNVYLQYVSDAGVSVGTIVSYFPMYLIVLGPDGNELSRSEIPAFRYVAAKDGIGYATRYTIGNTIGRVYTPASVTDLSPENLYAFDLLSGREIWNHTFTADNLTVETVDKSVAYPVFNYDRSGRLSPGSIPNNEPISSRDDLKILPGNGIVYVQYESINYQNPTVFSQPERAYVDRVYEFNVSGAPLWYKPLPPDSKIWVMQNSTTYLKDSAAENGAISPDNAVSQNSTILYRTPDGRFGAIGTIGAGVAGGLTIMALAYLFLHFFCVGAVARTRARFSHNDNRKRIMDFIVRNPGSTLYEIARGTRLNLGTVKYHMLILGMNHRIVSSRMDGKYIRYFTNSNSYSQDEQLVLSLMRRDTIGKVLGLILQKPGISNIEIARELDIRESVACRCLKELSEKGVVAKDYDSAKCSYSIHEAYSGHVADAIKRLQGQ